MKLRFIMTMLTVAVGLTAAAQPTFNQKHGLYEQESLTVEITPSKAGAIIYYTTDGSEPTDASLIYGGPLLLQKTTLLRAVEKTDKGLSAITTASYIFMNSVLSQPNNPEGYPSHWGSYTDIDGQAIADYEMDPDMTNDLTLRPKIIQGLKDLPILSVVTDKNNFFSFERDEQTGGIYIYTGTPVGDPIGNGWVRKCSAELFGGQANHDLTIDCGIRLHGGHGRLAEKNPKHSMRLVFKKDYGPKELSYPIFGENESKTFSQLVLRCHYGNSWQHWQEYIRERAQFTRDVWARRMQRRMGHLSVNAVYAHLFINGMYWGLYNIAERINDTFGVEHLGGKKKEIDVIKIEEEGGNHIEASEGTLDAWEEMLATVKKAADPVYYQKLDTLLDIPTFIDYMLINQYAGNNDWDHHNWYAIRRKGTSSEGFKFLCWDSEMILEGVNDNVVTKNNGYATPTGIFNDLLQNPTFARQYVRRAKEVLSADGLLGQQSVVEVWDSLYNIISNAIYAEAARWGDYRRDVHPYTSMAPVYTVDGAYMKERNRLLTTYFPYRTERALSDVLSYVAIDDFEAPAGWQLLSSTDFHSWTGPEKNAQAVNDGAVAEWNVGSRVDSWGTVAGFSDVGDRQYADISQYDQLVLRGTGDGVRILANRALNKGPWKEHVYALNSTSPYWNADLGGIIIPLSEFKAGVPERGTEERIDDFMHINAIKVAEGHSATVRAIYLVPAADVNRIAGVRATAADDAFYTLSGQRVQKLTKGVFVKNGKKIIVR